MMYYEDYVTAVELKNGKIVDLGKNPAGLYIYTDDGSSCGDAYGFQAYDDSFFIPAYDVAKVKFVDSELFVGFKPEMMDVWFENKLGFLSKTIYEF